MYKTVATALSFCESLFCQTLIENQIIALLQIVAGVENSCNVHHDDICSLMLFSDSKMLDVNVTCMRGGTIAERECSG